MIRRQAAQTADSRMQSQRFIKTAREIGCDDDEAAFRDKLGVLAKEKPERPKAEVKKRR